MRSLGVFIFIMMIIVLPALAERSLRTDGQDPPFQPPLTIDDGFDGARMLVNDGSFEFGGCDDGSAWTCIANTGCEWILDPMPLWGYPAFDGLLAAWLGGFCEGEPNSNSFCQDLEFWGCSFYLTFYWMGYVTNDGGNFVYVTSDGAILWEHELTLADHTYGIWTAHWGVGLPYHGEQNICFEFVATTGANMLIDYVTSTMSPTPVEPTSFSTLKSRY